jgi:molybdopterin-containing oxidoreductase family membrane subunit
MFELADARWIARGHERCAFSRFTVWIVAWTLLLAFGVFSAFLCLYEGLNQTNMDNRFAFGLWIFLDLAIIALGAGAFFTGFLLYILKWRELKAVINSAVVIGFVCYSGAVAVLMVDVGQPLRAWFTFWHPNTHSMLTEVTFCISCYLLVLAIEYLPVILKNRRLRQSSPLLVFEFELHKVIPVLAGVGTVLSFFHQGSLGGLYGVLRGHPFAFREGIGIWPSTFFLFILSAIAVGPSFLLLITRTVQQISGRRLVKPEVFHKLAATSGVLLAVYVLAKAVDTLVWLNSTSREAGFLPWEYYSWKPFGTWLLFTEIGLCGLVPAAMLMSPRIRARRGMMITAATLACLGILLNRFVLTIQTLSLPTLPFDEFLAYTPSWQEVGTFVGVIAYGVLVYSLSFRYLNLFPQERELKIATEEVEHVSGR